MSKVYWVTGISGVGKTTFSKILKSELEKKHIDSVLIDGDEIRKILKIQNKYSKKDRLELATIYSKLAKLISDQKITVIVSTISLIEEIHMWNKKNLKNYVEILIERDMSEIIKSDSRNVYKEKNIVGKSINAEYPKNPNFIINNLNMTEIKEYIRNFILI